ncbi:cyclase/dehydrase [Candidatus Koribacter versatilis Ellin345]|uniref:Cyclase/dehydrase n=1 Tax=Koribacter versatilis (strain Ellin345) TaxID=204669 RepID=Q1IM90_KORVE|nr:SRPBCC family protein [Candidatus Koribacter versatilis]ABF42010.1 cyclase/dehydrase [Candidatus Koribacter versatilis Ellin345]
MDNRNSRTQADGFNSRLRRIEPWASIVGGGALTAFGISRKSLAGATMAAAGGYLIYRAATNGRRASQNVHVQRSFTIMKPVAEVYAYWRNFQNLPNIMTHLENVEVRDDRRSHWTALGPMGLKFEWDAEIIDERENEFIVWRSVEGADIENRGSVQFFSVLNGEGTEISAAIDYAPPAGILGAKFAQLFGRNPEQQVREDLRAFKALMEAGEIPTIEGQPHGKRSAFVKAARVAYPGHKRSATNVKAIRQPAEQLA